MKDSKNQTLSEIILPPGSTSSDLQRAIDNAASGYMIIISYDMLFTDTVTIPDKKEITVLSSANNNWILTQTNAGSRHFMIQGNMTLQNVILDGSNAGGGVFVHYGNFTMNGVLIRNCHNNSGGGVLVAPNGTFTMNGGEIQKNVSDSTGGGVMFYKGKFTMNNGKIVGNTARANGGGFHTPGVSASTVIVSGGSISGNTAGSIGGGISISGDTSTSIISDVIISGNTATHGGGVYIGDATTISGTTISENTAVIYGGGAFIEGTATMSDVVISENRANNRGGGIYTHTNSKMEITGESYIIGNSAPNGGGIFAANAATISDSTVFRCNRASEAYQPPDDADTLYPTIKFAGTTIADHPLNNFDINYICETPIEVFYKVIYNANGGIGDYTGANIVPGETDTVLSPAETKISHPNYTFLSWNTAPNGTGISYAPGDIIIIPCDVILFAQWCSVALE